MITFGLTGNICCGKSTVSKTFVNNNIPMVDCDIVARQVVEVDKPAWAHLWSEFGPSFFNQDRSLNRLKLGNLVFSNKDELNKLNYIMEPHILNEVQAQVNTHHKQGHQLVGVDGALIVEMKMTSYRPLIVVYCTPEQQLDRLMKRGTGHGPLTRSEAMLRIDAQIPMIQKMESADYLINTSSDIESSIKRTVFLIQKLNEMLCQKC